MLNNCATMISSVTLVKMRCFTQTLGCTGYANSLVFITENVLAPKQV